MQNGDVESFSGRMRDELLNESLFFGLDHARAAIADWVAHFNAARPHSSLGYQTPADYAEGLTTTGTERRNRNGRDSNRTRMKVRGGAETFFSGHSRAPLPQGRGGAYSGSRAHTGDRSMPDTHAQRIAPTLTEWRRYLHQHPELSLREEKTAAFVCERLKELGIPFESGIGGHGVVATLRRGGNRSVGLRADMDALPITEATGLPYASKTPGVMHACGHDGHTTSLLGAAMLLRDDPDWSGTVHFVFQPAEEGFGGALAMMEDGLFRRFPMERIFGYHNWPGVEAGAIMIHDGPMMAQGERIGITIHGHAGHAAMPNLTADPVVCAAQIIVALQSVVSRNINPLDAAVISICVLRGAEADNQIPDTVTLRGTVRALLPEVFDHVTGRIREIVAHTASAMGCRGEVIFERRLAATINHKDEAALGRRVARDLGMPVLTDLPPTMASEDFGWYLREIPGAYAWIGNGPATEGAFLHNQNYNFNDEILPIAAGYLASTAKAALAG